MGSSSVAIKSPDNKKNKMNKGLLGFFRPAAAAGAGVKSPKNKDRKSVGEDQATIMSPPTTTKASSWFCRTKYFRQMCDTAFAGIDLDGSGEVDEKELYSGLLLIHLKMGCYAGPAACKPLSRERVQKVFCQYDTDGSGCLDREEFRSVMTVLFGNVFFRVLVQWSMTLMIVPLIAQAVVDGAQQLWQQLWHLITSLDEQYKFVDDVQVTIEKATMLALHQFAFLTPYTDPMTPYAEKMKQYVAMVPESVWEAIPLAIISTVLGMMVVPWCIFKVDDFFQKFAEKDVKTTKVKRA
jgi:Ca2+-binding EF-hand superfamily protein